ncbi:hypothetical protein F5883DRAFT_723001 [Diaporthe sp. PMI_573]|nr:hypothetical protein F5883DRAFT_723001 [Diaporthaceae sp. PMI_573]
MSWPNMVYLQKLSVHDVKDLLPPEARKIFWMCRFQGQEDLAEFQSQMLGEDIALDISSVRAAKMTSKQNGKHTENNIPGCRVQIWHERRGSHDMLSDNASYISNDTVLSGPSKGKTRPRYDRLLIFFGRLEQYMSLFITDDIELQATGHVSVCIMARKYTGRHLFRSRGSIKGYFAYRTSHAAGFIVGAATTTPLEQDSYVTLDGIEIEFESRREFDNFNEIWNQALSWRCEQRRVLKGIQEEMDGEQFTGRHARRLLFHSG